MLSYPQHRVFISYHHKNDQLYKKKLLELNSIYKIFADESVDTGDIDPNLPAETIREKIRDDYLKVSTVTVLLVGIETSRRKHIDWELFSSMINGKKNKKSGIVVVQLPSTNPQYFHTAYGEEEKEKVYPDCKNWTNITSRSEYERRFPYVPTRIIDQFISSEVKLSITQWERLGSNLQNLAFLINSAYNLKVSNNYDLSRSMRMQDS